MVIDHATSTALIGQNRKNQTGLQKIFGKLSSGKRINRASDDAAMLSIARELEKQVRGFQTVETNIDDALSAIRIADGASGSISDLLQRQRELAIQANNGTIGQNGRDALNKEFQALSAEIDRISQAAQFNKQQLLDGTSQLSNGSGQIQVGTSTNDHDQINMPQANLRSANLGIDNLDISDAANINAAINGLDTAMEKVNATRTTQGAAFNQFAYAQEGAANTRINTSAALSQAEDLDYAQGVAEMARQSLLQESNFSALDNFNEIARNNVLALLG